MQKNSASTKERIVTWNKRRKIITLKTKYDQKQIHIAFALLIDRNTIISMKYKISAEEC